MSWVTWVLFESLPALGAALALLLFVLLVYWRRSGRGRPLLAGLAVALALLVAQRAVVTQREAAGRVLTPIERGIEGGRVEALAAALTDDFAADTLGRAEFVELVRERQRRVEIRYINRLGVEVESASPERFVAIVRYTADVTIDGLGRPLPSTWAVTFVHTPAGWRIQRIACRRLAMIDNPTLHEIGRL